MPLILSPMGQIKLAILTRVFFTRICMAVFARRPNKVAVMMRWPQGTGFHCILSSPLSLFNNYSPKAKLILLNNPRDEVEGIIQQY